MLKPIWYKIFDGVEYILLITALIACGGAIWWVYTPRVTVKDIDKLIQKELPTGSSKTQVYKFLDAHHITSGAYQVGPDPNADQATAERKRFIRGWIQANRTRFFNPSYISVYLYFDEQQNLSEYRLSQSSSLPKPPDDGVKELFKSDSN